MMKNAWRGAWRDLRSLAHALGKRLFEERLTQAAGSLTYTTLLSLVPLLTVALALSTAFPAFDRTVSGLQDWVFENFLPDAGMDQVVEQLGVFTESVGRLTTIGVVGVGITAVLLMLTIDDVLNRIFRVERKRPMVQRVTTYWTVLTVGPILIGTGISMTSALVAGSFGRLDLDDFGELLLRLMPFVLTWLALALLYFVVPNRPVPLRHALVGGFVAGVVFELAKRGFALYVTHFPSYAVVYGTFATLLFFLVWVYLSWLIVLAGATLTALLVERRKHFEDSRSRQT